MKKIIYILLVVFVAFSCKDFNVDEDWLDDSGKPTNVAAYEYTMTDADYTPIANGLRANKTKADSLRATQLLALKKFTPDFKPSELIPYLLDSKYFTADLKSSAKITYKYDAARDAVVSGLSGAGYIMTNDDYKQVWGSSPLVISLTPVKAPSKVIPDILKGHYADAADGSYKTVEYYYSNEEPVSTPVETKFLEETFEGYSTGSTVPVTIDGWLNKDVKGALFWQSRVYSGNNYAQVSSYNSKVENEVWLIAKQVDLSKSVATPKFSFDIVTGNYNGDGLKVLISQDFDGKEANVTTATWTDITSSFNIPAPASGYSAWASAGTLDLTAYKGKKIYIAFKYIGNDLSAPKVTTTYQIDNVKVSEVVIGTDVKEKSLQFASFIYSASDKTWKTVGAPVIVLQPADYAKLEIATNTMSATQAKDLLPQYLVRNVIGTEGVEKVLVYRTKAGEFYAEKYTFKNGTWILNTTLSDQTSQFVRGWDDDAKKKKWVFDPTIIFGMVKSDYNLVVEYSREHNAPGNEGIYVTNANGNSEFYYGFAARYSNITYRHTDRSKDKTYPTEASDAEKIVFMNQRTKDGLAILLTLKYPNATPEVSGVMQYAEIRNVLIYSEPGITQANIYWNYIFQCIGDKEWKFISRESITDGRTEVAPK